MKHLEAALTKQPSCSLVLAPTPLHRLSNLEKELGHQEIYIKRDDLTGYGAGGNKLRSLEFILGEAKAHHHDVIIAAGPLQSNFCTLTAAACAKESLKCILVHNGEQPQQATGNVLLNNLLGVESHFIGNVDSDSRKEYERSLFEKLKAKGHNPYIAANGATTGVGALGHVKAILELVEQTKAMNITLDTIFVSGGNGGMAAGLVYANAICGFPFEINVISVEHEKEELSTELYKTIADIEAILKLKLPRSLEASCNLIDEYRGAGWGESTPESRQAVLDFPRQEGIFIENIYISKVVVGMKDCIAKGRTKGNACFIHSGGFGSLFSQYN